MAVPNDKSLEKVEEFSRFLLTHRWMSFSRGAPAPPPAPAVPLGCSDIYIDRLKWPLPDLRSRIGASIFYTFRSLPVFATIGGGAKLLMTMLNKFSAEGQEPLLSHLSNRRKGIGDGRGLVTISNHYSCFDEPGLWAALLPYRELLSPSTLRWSFASHNVCFTNPLYSAFFASAKGVPVVRGWGVYQRGMDFMLERLEAGEWVHMFPEGKVNAARENLRLKWGVGRLIAEAKVTPLVLPMWHIGMDEFMPNQYPYRPRLGQRIFVFFGNPIDFKDSAVLSLETARERRKAVTDLIQTELFKTRQTAEQLWTERFLT